MTPDAVFIQFADNGNIRKWDKQPFPEGAEYRLAAALPHLGWRADAKLKFGDRVTKTKGASWTGRVVGFYSTALTPIGYAVESENEPGSVQIYPEAALMPLPPPPSSKEDRT